VDFSRGLLQLLLSSVSHARQLTFAPRTPAPPRKQLLRTSALAWVGYGGVYPGRGQMSSTSSDDGGAYSRAHLICKCVTVRSLYVRMMCILDGISTSSADVRFTFRIQSPSGLTLDVGVKMEDDLKQWVDAIRNCAQIKSSVCPLVALSGQ